MLAPRNQTSGFCRSNIELGERGALFLSNYMKSQQLSHSFWQRLFVTGSDLRNHQQSITQLRMRLDTTGYKQYVRFVMHFLLGRSIISGVQLQFYTSLFKGWM